jgi:catechol 2,3-dioxygenase-like lactoylglutathione lyase family enzyme
MNLNQVTVAVSNIEQSIKFYEKLGLTIIVKSPNYARFECPQGDTTFSIIHNENVKKENTTHIYFECDDIDNCVDELIKNGIEFTELPTDKAWLWREAHLNDLDGNRLILYYAGLNRKNPPWRI